MVLAHQFAIENVLIQAEMVEAMEFAELAGKFGVSGVPHTIINEGAGEIVGAAPEDYLLEEIRRAVS